MFDQKLDGKNTLTGTQGRGISFLKRFSVMPFDDTGWLRTWLCVSKPPPSSPPGGTRSVLKRFQLSRCFQDHSPLSPGPRKADSKVAQTLSLGFLLHMNFSSVSKYLTSRRRGEGGEEKASISTLKQSFISKRCKFSLFSQSAYHQPASV